MLNLTIKRWFKEVFGFVTEDELDPKSKEIATLNHIQNHLDHVKAHTEYLKFLDKGFNEQVKTRKTRRVSKGTNKTFKKRAKKGKSNNKKPRKGFGIYTK